MFGIKIHSLKEMFSTKQKKIMSTHRESKQWATGKVNREVEGEEYRKKTN